MKWSIVYDNFLPQRMRQEITDLARHPKGAEIYLKSIYKRRPTYIMQCKKT